MIDAEERGRTSRPSAPPSIAYARLLVALAPIGCGGGVALLHPARTLDEGQVRAAAGFSANVGFGRFASALGDARAQTSAISSSSTRADEISVKGALVAASIAPGLAPFIGARVGLGASFEGGLTYTGRGARADVRRSFDLSRHWALSVGAGGSAALQGRHEGVALPDVDLTDLHGWGADMPVLIGYASDGDLYTVWLGPRAGWEQVDVTIVRNGNASSGGAPSGPAVMLSATRFWGGALVGLAVGFRRVHVSMELDASYASVTGDYAGVRSQLEGVVLAPATAVWWRF
jgi:hypothetical protein